MSKKHFTLDDANSEIADEVVDIISERLGIKLHQKDIIPLIFEGGAKEVADIVMRNLKKKIGTIGTTT